MRHSKALLLAFIFFIIAPFSSSRQGTSHSPAKAITPPPNVPPTKGSIGQGTYKNPSIGLEFTPADNLHLDEPEIEGTSGTTGLVIRIRAVEGGVLSGLLSPRSVTIFYADALAYYPENQRSAPVYVDKLIRTNKSMGYQMVHDVTQDQISGIPFVRTDFVKGDVHESVFVTNHDAYAFVFIFGGSDFAVINKLIASTKVKLTP